MTKLSLWLSEVLAASLSLDDLRKEIEPLVSAGRIKEDASKPYNRSDMTRKARLDHDALNIEAEPFLESGDLIEFGNERHWYQIVGTPYQVYAEEDADPNLEGTYSWSIIETHPEGTPDEDEIIDYGYDLGEIVKKYKSGGGTAAKPPQPSILPDGTSWSNDLPPAGENP